MNEIKELKQQIEETKVCIAKLESKLVALEESEVKPWEPKGGDWCVTSDGEVLNCKSVQEFRLHGREFQTKEQALKASRQFEIYQLMYQAYIEVMGDEEVDWSSGSRVKFYVAYDHLRCNLIIRDVSALQYPFGFYFNAKDQAKRWKEMVGDLIPELGRS